MHEQAVNKVEQAQALSRTRMCWVVHYLVDLSAWDWLWEPPPWQAHQRHAWRDQHGQDAGVYLVPQAGYQDTNYHTELTVHRVTDPDHWHIPDWIDPDSVDLRWSPDPCDPPYIYEFPVEWSWDRVGGPQYRVPGATDIKYVTDFVARTRVNALAWYQHCEVEWPEHIRRWRPCPTDPPYDYVFGNQWYSAEIMPTVEYRMPGALGKKYMDLQVRLPQRHSRRWHTLYDCEWDYSWVPDPGDPPYIYVWGNQWWPAEKMPTVEYHVPGATERKYMNWPARLLSDRTNWQVPHCVDSQSIDFSWCPDPGDPPYIYEFATQWQPNGGAVYHVPGATQVKYVAIQHRKLTNSQHWIIPDTIDPASVDLSWHPDVNEPPYIYEFATQWQPNGGAVYHVPGATERKYVDIQHRRLPDPAPWQQLVAVESFDLSWHPDNTEPAYCYVFGNQHWPGTEMPSMMYVMPGATEQKFIDYPRAQLAANRSNWQVLEDIDYSAWDWTWVPNPQHPPYIYQWGNQWNPPELYASVQYCVPGATEIKHMEQRTRRLADPNRFECLIPVKTFDFSWQPNPTEPPMTYVWGNQWNPPELEPTVRYVAGGTDIKYMHDQLATVEANTEVWVNLDDVVEFDYSWRPNPTDPPYIYVFGNQWMPPQVRPALEYTVPGATERKYMDQPRARRRGQPEKFRQIYPADFDWSWEPDPGSPPYIYVWGNQYYSAEVMPTVEYTVPGASERKYMTQPALLLPCQDHWQEKVACHWDYTWRPEPGSPPYIYVFGNQWWSAEKMPTMEYHMPGATERKYMTTPVAQLFENLANWHIPSAVDATDMDFSWVPDPGEPPYIYQFATQHQKTGGPQYRVPGATEFKYVDWQRAQVRREAAPIFEIDHMDGNAGQIPNTVRRIRYFDNYRDTLIRLARSLVGEYEHVWVCSSVCDYTDFDFSWHPESWQSTMLHVFASDEQKFGDTFYMHVPTFAERAEKKQLLEWYAVNYVARAKVPRRPMPVFVHDHDSHVDAVKTSEFTAPLALFTTEAHIDRAMTTVPLWRQEVKTITPISRGATAVIVPKAAVALVKTQLYDYAYIDKTKARLLGQPLDIVYVSHGEPNAEENWLRLKSLAAKHPGHIHRVDAVTGRVAAYHAAARASTTAWFFAVFAKLKVDAQFDWSWQPDRMQQAKHYIFHAQNPVNGLTYGHQAMIAYNRALTLANRGVGLDFTLDSPHEVVPVLSGVADYAQSPWMAWRTAFREVIKLQASLPDVENQYRLGQWLDHDNSPGQWSQRGAQDAVEYYESVAGDIAQLKLSYDWAWLASYALMRRGLVPDP